MEVIILIICICLIIKSYIDKDFFKSHKILVRIAMIFTALMVYVIAFNLLF